MSKALIQKIGTVVSLFAVIFYFIPFFGISCGGTEIATLSGYQLTFGSEIEGTPIDPTYFLLILLICPVVIMIFSIICGFINDRLFGFAIVNIIISLVDAIALGITYVGVISSAEDQGLTATCKPGFILELICILLLFVLNIVGLCVKSKRPKKKAAPAGPRPVGGQPGMPVRGPIPGQAPVGGQPGMPVRGPIPGQAPMGGQPGMPGRGPIPGQAPMGGQPGMPVRGPIPGQAPMGGQPGMPVRGPVPGQPPMSGQPGMAPVTPTAPVAPSTAPVAPAAPVAPSTAPVAPAPASVAPATAPVNPAVAEATPVASSAPTGLKMSSNLGGETTSSAPSNYMDDSMDSAFKPAGDL